MFMKYIKGFKIFKEQVDQPSIEATNQKIALERRWNDYKSKKSQIPLRVDNMIKNGDMRSIILQKDDLSKSKFKDLITNGSDQKVNEFTMAYLLFIIEQRKKWNDNNDKILKIEDEIKSISDTKTIEKDEIESNKKKVEALQKDLISLRTLQSNYNKSVMDKEKELENIYNRERRDLETEISISKNLDKKEDINEKNPPENK